MDGPDISDDESVMTELTAEINIEAEKQREKEKAQQDLARIRFKQLYGHKGAVTSCSYVADDSRVLTSSNDTTCKLWDAQTSNLLQTFRGHTRQVSRLATAQDGKRFFSCGWDKRALHWDIETGACIWEGQHDSIVTTCAYSHEGKITASGSDFDSTLRLWDTREGKVAHLVSGLHDSTITSINFCRSDDRLYTTSNDRSIKFYDLRMQSVTLVLKSHSNVVSNATLTDEERILASVSWDKTIRLWDIATGQFSVSKPEKSLSKISAKWAERRSLLDKTSGPTILSGGHDGSISCCDFSSDQSFLLTGGYDRTVVVWDMQNMVKRFRIAAHEDWVMDAQFSHDDKSILTCSRDGLVRIWNIERVDQLPVVFEERRSIGLRLVKCKNCGRSYSVSQAEVDPRNVSMCVFCRLAENERSLNLHAK